MGIITPDQLPKYQNRANQIVLTRQLLEALRDSMNVDMPYKSLQRAFGCGEWIKIVNGVVTSHFCGNRFCLVCNRIRTAKLINGYKRPLESLPDLQFVTLTIVNCNQNELADTIRAMYRSFYKAKDNLRKQGFKVLGIRKLEITFNDVQNTYHPHFHCIISGQIQGVAMIDEWLRINKTSISYAQDIQNADNNAVMELFKYFTKLKSNNSYSQNISILALKNIIFAIRGVRIFQPFGVKMDKNTYQKPVIEDIEHHDVYYWRGSNWVNQENKPIFEDIRIWNKTLQFGSVFEFERQ